MNNDIVNNSKIDYKYDFCVFILTTITIALLAACWPSSAQAKTPTDAGVLQQQIERDTLPAVPLRPLRPATGTDVAPDIAPAKGEPTVVVAAFTFQGNTLLDDLQLRVAVAHLVGRPLGYAALQSSADTVADLYRQRGLLVQAYLPSQDISDGQVTMVVVEAVFGQAVVLGTPSQRVNPQRVLDLVQRQQQAGAYVQLDALERALLLAEDLPGVSVTGNLSAGAQDGQTDLVLQLVDKPFTVGSASLENTGSVSTGSMHANLALAINSPSGQGDAINLNAMASEGTRYARVAYSLPLGADGWRVAVNASYMDYRLVSEAYQSLNASGQSHTSGWGLSYPLVRSRSANLLATVGGDYKSYTNVSGGATASDYRNDTLSVGLSGNSVDGVGVGGYNAFSLMAVSGQLDLSRSPTQAGDALTTQAAGSFDKLRYSLTRQQDMGPALSVWAALSGQWAAKNLDSSEKFYLGGSNGVRAYPGSEGAGARGQMVNLELRWSLSQNFSLVGFYDWGSVTVNADNSYTGAAQPNTYSLEGTGLALAWRNSAGLNVQLTYARRLGNNPNPITTAVNQGYDQDGTLVLNRFWLSATLPF